MSYVQGIAADVGDFLAKLNAFLTVGHALDPQYSGIGTGTITNLSGTAESVPEAITISFSTATEFAVSGSASGELGAGVVGAEFDCAVCQFTVQAGDVAWAAGDTIIFAMSPKWNQMRSVNLSTGTDEYVWCAPGNDGLSAIYVGLQRFRDTGSGDYDNVRLGGFTGYNAASSFAAQPGVLSRPVTPLLRVGNIPYWFVANGRRCIIIAKVSTVYEGAYLGFLNAYQDPGALPYPLVIGGSMSWANEPVAGNAQWRWSYQGAEHALMGIFNGQNAAGIVADSFSLRFRRPDGTWRGFTCNNTEAGNNAAGTGYIWPYSARMNDLRPNLDGAYTLYPIALSEDFAASNGNPNQWGELDGVLAVTGYGNSAENLIIPADTRIPHLVLQNIFRTTKTDYCAVKLA